MSKQFAQLDDASLVKELAISQRKLVEARFALAMDRLENTASVRAIRKSIAQINTEIRRREMAANLPKQALVAKHPVDASLLKGESTSAGAADTFLDDTVDSQDV